MYQYQCRVTKVVDGDTMHVTVSLGLDSYQNITLRLAGLDTPEMSTPEGKTAKVWVQEWVDAHVDSDGYLPLATIKDRREKYGRYLAVVGTLNDELLSNGIARPYDGGKR